MIESMIDLRDYKDYIQKMVALEDEKDKKWRWSVESVEKSLVRIRWGYLDYLEEKNNCFLIEKTEQVSDQIEWLWIEDPDGGYLESYMITNDIINHDIEPQDMKRGLRYAIKFIADVARECC